MARYYPFMKLHLLLIPCIFIFLGCSQKVPITFTEPALIDQVSSKKNISVLAFSHDSVGLSGMIETQLAQNKFQQGNYFTLISRKNLAPLLDEQKLQSTDLINHATATKVGEFLGVEAIITGEVTSATTQSSFYYKEKKKCVRYNKDKKCILYKPYKVRCNVLRADLSANIAINDVQNAQVIYADSLSRNKSVDSCYGYNLPSKQNLLNTLAKSIALHFSSKLTPQKRIYHVTLIDSLDIDLNDLDEEKFEHALEYIEAKRLDKAKVLLEELLDSYTSYAVAYNLGILYESVADLKQAKELYMLADSIAQEPIEPINQALIRIEISINKHQALQRQLDARG